MSAITKSAGCVTHSSLFQDPALEEAIPSSTGARAQLHNRAAAVCATCPLVKGCLYDAVVRYDVAGFVAGTTARERRSIRANLGIAVESENLDTLAGVTATSHRVDRDEVLRLRRANPDETLEQLAMRLGCSMSTVKRHLRKSRREVDTASETLSKPRPSMEAVWAAAQRILGPRHGRIAA